jgi:hypothetical protein
VTRVDAERRWPTITDVVDARLAELVEEHTWAAERAERVASIVRSAVD